VLGELKANIAGVPHVYFPVLSPSPAPQVLKLSTTSSDRWWPIIGTAYEQLAIYYERKAHDPEQAREIVKQALDELRRAIQVGDIAPGPYREIKARFDHRMKRLERKSDRPLLEGLVSPTQA
jgi:hypothetical protein